MIKNIFKKLDLISALLILFLVSLPLFLFLANSINSNVKEFSKQSDYITKLKLIDKDLNYFISQKGLISNYDKVNKKMSEFEDTIELLKENLKKNIYSNNNRYIDELKKISKDFQIKKELIEHTKSYNSIILNSLNYLHDLKKNFYKLSKIEYSFIDDILFLSVQLYANNLSDQTILEKKIQKLKDLSKRLKDQYLVYFYEHEKSIISMISALKNEQTIVNKRYIYERLDKLFLSLKQDFNSYLTIIKATTAIVLALIGFFILSVLNLHNRSIKNEKELVAYKFAIENSDNSIVITDANYNITYVNQAFEKITGYKKEEVLGQNPRILKSDLSPKYHYENLHKALQNRQKWTGEFINKDKKGNIFYEKASISPIIVDNKLMGYISIKLDITDYINQQKHIKFLAYHDSLTSLANRVYFENFFKENIQNSDKKYALMYLDIDNFKTINDTLGHQTGDTLLKRFTRILKRATTKDDFLARIGGDEFIILSNIKDDPKKIDTILKKIQKNLNKNMNINGHSINITTSIGIALYPSDANSLENLLKYADIALYQAKLNGKNNYQFFNENLSKLLYERHTLEQELYSAIKNGELHVVYQPKYEIYTQKMIGFEALVRWQNKKLGFVPPDRFITVAEEIGLINDIGDFVYEQACKDFYNFKQKDPGLKHIAINISTKQFLEEDFIDKINTITKRCNLEPSDIELEMTETYLMKNIDKNIKYLKKLRDFGYKIAIDDFGTGYSSFSYLKKMPISTLKIDKSFIDDICLDIKDKTISQTIITLAKNLGFETVAEGIEYKEQEELLKQMGCDIGQGYLFSKPIKSDDIITLLKEELQRYKSIKEVIEMEEV